MLRHYIKLTSSSTERLVTILALPLICLLSGLDFDELGRNLKLNESE